MLVDSHCHLHLLDLQVNGGDLSSVIAAASAEDVERLLSVSVELGDASILQSIADQYPMVNTSVGVHPNTPMLQETTVEHLCQLAQHPSCIALGETGLDYYRQSSNAAYLTQQERFRIHIRAAREAKKPLIIHTRAAAEDTLRLLKEEKADEIGGVMHCFAEDWNIAMQALALNFYISFSGIVTFKNAHILQEVAKKVPIDRILIETDSPYLAPVPHRGKPNQPAFVKYVAEYLSRLRDMSYPILAAQTTQNFYQCFAQGLTT